uniref:Rho-GAP domain-containing protein n=1 Tax=Syphacia muris TaxID=451379 RepID=A0A0N5AVU0_9BILA
MKLFAPAMINMILTAWSKYCKELLTYVSRRMQLESEHAKRVQSLVAQTKLVLNEFQNFLPLKDVFYNSFESDIAFCEQTYEAAKHVQDKSVKALEMRKDDHDRQRRLLKNEWTRVNKQVKDTQQELVRARSLLDARVDGYRRAQESFENTKAISPPAGSDAMRRRKELERRKKNEEEAHNKRIDAESNVKRLETELCKCEHQMQEAKIRIVGQLRELVYRCDQTTKACSTHYFQALTNLWVSQPGKYHEFTDATRNYSPGSEYISYLQNHMPRRTLSSGSLYRGENEEDVSSTNRTESSSSFSSQRRNAIDLNDSELTHHFQKVRQPTRCAHCDSFSIFSTVQCSQCRMMWHKACVPRISVVCDQRLGTSTESRRRMSIFGVSLNTHLSGINRQFPLILECCIDELQRHGLRVRGIYRTCGVKSKVEQICEEFEKAKSQKDVDLTSYHPMNIASVVKLYLRQLPQPLLTQELYNDWMSLAGKNLTEPEPDIVEKIKDLLEKLPPYNYATLKYLILHLNRVTWFEMDNLMTASNLGAVISPSLIWKHPSSPYSNDSSFFTDAHLMSKAVELLIKLAFEIFGLDRSEDWKLFFQQHPEIEEPQTTDVEIESHIMEEEIDDSMDDEDPDSVCLVFQAQPPTPDLLKNTSRNSASDDLDLDSSLGSSLEPCGSINSSVQRFAFNPIIAPQLDRSTTRLKLEKKRSYTTSVIVSPRSEKKPQKFNSVDVSEIDHYSGDNIDFSLPPNQVPQDVTDVPGDSRTKFDLVPCDISHICYSREGSDMNHNPNDTSRGDANSSTKICWPSVGVLFSGSDVSYVPKSCRLLNQQLPAPSFYNDAKRGNLALYLTCYARTFAITSQAVGELIEVLSPLPSNVVV